MCVASTRPVATLHNLHPVNATHSSQPCPLIAPISAQWPAIVPPHYGADLANLFVKTESRLCGGCEREQSRYRQTIP
jgi:hypothetical protein